MPALFEADEAAATEFLTRLLSAGLVYDDQGKYAKSKAQDVSTTLARLLGSGAHWWTNYRTQESWVPATHHTFARESRLNRSRLVPRWSPGCSEFRRDGGI